MKSTEKPHRTAVSRRITAGHNRSVHHSAQDFDFHFHDYCELLLFLDGEGEMLVEQTRYPLRRGSLLAFNTNEVHRVFPAPGIPYERITIHFEPQMIHALPLRDCNLLSCFRGRRHGTGNAVLLAGAALEAYCRIARELARLSSAGEPMAEARALSRLVELLAIANVEFETVLPAPPAFTGFVADAVAYVEEHISEELSLAALARRYSVNPYHFSHQFRLQTGTSPYHYVLVKRIALAKQLLAEGSGCGQACELAGFGDYNNFSRTFKKYVGDAPGSYRRQHR